jgi:hypothetical protein
MLSADSADVHFMCLATAAGAACCVWVLKWIGDYAKRKKGRSDSRQGLKNFLNKNLWNFNPDKNGATSRIAEYTAWWRLIMVGIMLAGLMPAMLSPLIGLDGSLASAVAALLLWNIFLLSWGIKRAMRKLEKPKKLPVTIVTGFLVCVTPFTLNYF